MNLLKKVLLIFVLLLALMMIIVVIWSVYQRWRNPVTALDRGIIKPALISVREDTVIMDSGERRYRDVRLFHPSMDTIRLAVSLPLSSEPEGLPILIILGGLEIGLKSLGYIPDHGDNVLIAYQYPYSPTYWYDGAGLDQVPVIRDAVLQVPAQVESIARWALQQSWSDGRRISVLGYSFGAMFIPAIYRLSAIHQLPLGPAVMAYGGTDIFGMLKLNMRFLPSIPRTIIAWMAATAIYPIEPELHLPFLQGEFLLINGTRDHQISENSWKTLHRLTPEPKTVVVLDEGHMHPHKPELTLKLINLSREWLLARGAINF